MTEIGDRGFATPIGHGWIGVDFDGTLSTYDKFEGECILGQPIPLMVDRVKKWLKNGYQVRIITARISNVPEVTKSLIIAHIGAWCKEHIGEILPVVCCKDYGMIELWDDRAIQVHSNEGYPVKGSKSKIEREL